MRRSFPEKFPWRTLLKSTSLRIRPTSTASDDDDCDGVIDEWSDANPQCNDCSAIVDRDTVYYLCGLDADWFGAQEHCEQFGAQLVTLFDPETNELVRNAATDAGLAEVWIGLSDLTLEGEFVWVDGSRMTFDNFNDGQPDDFKMAEDCVEMEPAGPVSGLWNDIPCDLPLTAFICEGPAS